MLLIGMFYGCRQRIRAASACLQGDSETATIPLIRGRLVYANGMPVNRGTVCVGEERCLADAAGHFAIAAPAGDPCEYHLGHAFAPAGRTTGVFFWSPGQSEKSLTVVVGFPCTVRGRIVDSDGVPLPQASVRLIARPEGVTDDFWMLPSQARNDADGHFVFDDVPIGLPLELFVRVSGLPGHEIRVPIDKLVGDQTYDMDDVVVDSVPEGNLNHQQ